MEWYVRVMNCQQAEVDHQEERDEESRGGKQSNEISVCGCGLTGAELTDIQPQGKTMQTERLKVKMRQILRLWRGMLRTELKALGILPLPTLRPEIWKKEM